MPAPIPPQILEAFATSGLRNLIPETATGSNAASFDVGFPAITMQPEVAGGEPPLGQDVNGILYMLSSHTVYVESGNPYTYNATLAAAIGGYALGTILGSADGQSVWYCITANTTTNPDTDTTGAWAPLFGYGQTILVLNNANVVLTPAQYRKYFIVLQGALTGNVQIQFPTLFDSWLVLNETTGPYTVTAITAGGTGIVIPQTGANDPSGIFCDGANIQTTTISTAGLAPLASPVFTGTPRAPTASVGSNTTQVATTAFVQASIAGLASAAALGARTTPNESLVTDGYWQFPVGGFTLQWGYFTSPAGPPQAVVFPVPFAHACLAVFVCTGPRIVFGGHGANFFANFPTLTGFNAFFDQITGGNYGGYWLALGY